MIAAATQQDGQAFLGLVLLTALVATLLYITLGPALRHRTNYQRPLPHQHHRTTHSTSVVRKRKDI